MSVEIGLDLGTNLGWAVMRDGVIISHGTELLKSKREESIGFRYIRFRKFLLELVVANRTIDVIYWEEVKRHLGTSAAHMYGGYLATLQSWCDEYKIPYTGIPVQTIKKFATGKGNAKKGAMILAAQNLGLNPSSDNAADAIHIVRCGHEQYGNGVR